METKEEALAFVEKELNIELKGVKKKSNELVFARAVYYYICREHLALSYADIGRPLEKHHATVLHSVRDIVPFIKTKQPYKGLIRRIDNIFDSIQAEKTASDVEFIDTEKIEVQIQLREKIRENEHLRQQLESLHAQYGKLEAKYSFITSQRDLKDIIDRIPKRKKEEMFNKMLTAARLVYNG